MLSSDEGLLVSAGLTVFAIGPSTLAQGQTLVRQAGGNTTLALMLLVLSNTLAVFIAPFLIKAMLASRSDGIHLDSAGLLINLVVTVLAPSIVGKVGTSSCAYVLATMLSASPLHCQSSLLTCKYVQWQQGCRLPVVQLCTDVAIQYYVALSMADSSDALPGRSSGN